MQEYKWGMYSSRHSLDIDSAKQDNIYKIISWKVLHKILSYTIENNLYGQIQEKS